MTVINFIYTDLSILKYLNVKAVRDYKNAS